MTGTDQPEMGLLAEMEQEPNDWDLMDVVKLLRSFDFELAGCLGNGSVERWRHRFHRDLDVTLHREDREVHPARILHVVRIVRNLMAR